MNLIEQTHNFIILASGESNGYSSGPCELCLSRLAGDRFPLIVQFNDATKTDELSICLDCFNKINYGA